MILNPTGRPAGPLPEPAFLESVTLEDFTGSALFKDVKVKDLKKMLHNRYSRICKLDVGERLWTTRRGIDHVYLIIDGYVAISALSRFDPTRRTFLAWRGPEQIIGEMRPSTAEPSAAKIVACDRCKLLEMTSDAFMGYLVKNNPIIYRNIANLLLKKMASERRRSEVIQAPLIEMQVAQALIHLSEERCREDELKRKGSLKIPGTIHQVELGAYVGTVRETVNHPLSAFKKGGVISYGRGKPFTILDREELEEIAENPNTARKYQLKKRPKK
jgi:CRP-like cAMP-binding protein